MKTTAFVPICAGAIQSSLHYAKWKKLQRRRYQYKCRPTREHWHMKEKQSCDEENHPEHMKGRIIQSEHSQNILRNTDVAFILTGIMTTVAGGPIITAWSAIFFFIGRENDVPNWLRCLAAFLCSALTDAFLSNFSSLDINTGFLPYILFGLGTTVSAVLDYDEFFRLRVLKEPGARNTTENDSASHEKSIVSTKENTQLDTLSDIQEWDKTFEEKAGPQDL